MDVLTFETCWAVNSSIINKWHQVVLSLFNYQDDARSNKHKILLYCLYDYEHNRNKSLLELLNHEHGDMMTFQNTVMYWCSAFIFRGQAVLYSSWTMTIKLKAIWHFEMVETPHWLTQHHILDDWNPEQHCRENLKSCNIVAWIIKYVIVLCTHFCMN